MTYAKPNDTAGAGGGGREGGDTKKITNDRGVEDFVAISDNKGRQQWKNTLDMKSLAAFFCRADSQ
jgi:hypothetical protein